MTKSRNKGQTVGEKYSGIRIPQASGRTPASRFLLEESHGSYPCFRLRLQVKMEVFYNRDSSIFLNMEEFNLYNWCLHDYIKEPIP